MFCHNCGAELPADANFCSKCGKRLAAAEPRTDAEPAPADEVCEVVAEMAGEKWSPMFPADMMQFKAKAAGPQGEYLAAESPKFKVGLSEYYQPNQKNKRHVKALEELTAALTTAGWERSGKGREWYSLRFRRRQP